MPVYKKNSKGTSKMNAPTPKAVGMNFPMSPTTKGKVPALKFSQGFSQSVTKPATQTERPTPTKGEFELVIKVPGDNKANQPPERLMSPKLRSGKSPLGGKQNY